MNFIVYIQLILSMINSHRLPVKTMIGRLMILNKRPENITTVDSLRPINITSVLLKVWEYIVLRQILRRIAASESGYQEEILQR